MNRYISNTIWPHLIRADAVSSRHVSTSTSILTWTSTIAAALLILASVLAPLGLSDKILPGKAELVEFQYVRDPTPWGRVTMPRPNFKFSRYCEVGLAINCPGQYQGVYMNETEPGKWISVRTDESSTINITIPRNYTTMFGSATSDQGNTISGMFDIQFRRWAIDRVDIVENGQPYVRGEARHIESLIHQDTILLKEGLIIDMGDKPGIGFRNHTVPTNLEHGGIWSEDITFIEPITQCADTNLSADLRTETSVETFLEIRTLSLIDRGAFQDLEYSDLETRPWIDNQTLDLFAHAQKAARMHNVLVATSLDVALPLNASTQTLPPRPIGTDVFDWVSFDEMEMSELKGVGGAPPLIPDYDSSSSGSVGNSSSGNITTNTTAFVPRYPDGVVKLLALNYSAIGTTLTPRSFVFEKILTIVEQICQGYYRVTDIGNDQRAVNITYPAIKCGAVFGAPIHAMEQSLSASTFTGIRTSRKNVYICATAYKASIKTVTFSYNGTGADLTKLKVVNTKPKTYPDEASKPLWAVEHSFDRIMRFDPLWGLVNNSYETTLGFHTLRSESLWLPTSPSMTGGFGEVEGYDALAATGGFLKRLANVYGSFTTSGRDYTGKMEFALSERWSRLSGNQTTASQIPSLILTDGLAAGLVGTKTSFSSKFIQWPASLAVDDRNRGFPRAQIEVYRRVIGYDIRYAIPAFIVLALLLAALVGAIILGVIGPSITRTIRRTYNQTSAGRLATSLLRPGLSDPTQPSKSWVNDEGGLRLAFGRISPPEDDIFCRVVGDQVHAGSNSERITEVPKTENTRLLIGRPH